MNQYENKPATALLSHESLDVYQLALKFHLGVMTLLPNRSSPTLRDQLERASTSIILNIAEGAGRRTAADRRRYFVIAQGSTYECAAILDILRLRWIAQPSRCLNARNYGVRIAQMLGKLTR